VHWVPSQIHVSPSVPMSLQPPNRTISCRASSQAIAGARRGGGAIGGSSSVQLVPSQDHVSFASAHGSSVQSVPPNRITRGRIGSYAIPGEVRREGVDNAPGIDRAGRSLAPAVGGAVRTSSEITSATHG